MSRKVVFQFKDKSEKLLYKPLALNMERRGHGKIKKDEPEEKKQAAPRNKKQAAPNNKKAE
jgi:hypothetical protein